MNLFTEHLLQAEQVNEAKKCEGQDGSGWSRWMNDPECRGERGAYVYLIELVDDERAVDELIAYAEDAGFALEVQLNLALL